MASKELRKAWAETIAPGDYDQHMAAIGQAEANAYLVRDLIEAHPLEPGATIHFAGAGTGQMFDYVDGGFLRPYRVVFSDIRASFLKAVAERATPAGIEFTTEVRDIEHGHGVRIDAVVVVLVLEHVDWRRALRAMNGHMTDRLFFVIQINPPELRDAVSPNRVLPPSMAAVSSRAKPRLVSPEALVKYLRRLGFQLAERRDSPVADGKTMAGFVFDRTITPEIVRLRNFRKKIDQLNPSGGAKTERALRSLYRNAVSWEKAELARFVCGWRSHRAEAIADEWIEECLLDPEGHNQLFYLLPPRQGRRNVNRDVERWFDLLARPELPDWAIDVVCDNFPSCGSRHPRYQEAVERLADFLEHPSPEVRWTAIFRLATLRATKTRDRIAKLAADETKTKYYGYVSAIAKVALRMLDGDDEADLYYPCTHPNRR